MKILKYILFGVLGLVFLFLAIGMAKPSVSYGHEITANKPIEEAWAVTQDASKYDQWLEGFKSIELIEGQMNQPGSKYKVVVEPNDGQPDFEMIETLVSVKEFDHVEMHFVSEFMDFEQIMSLSESDGKTTVKTASKVIGKNLMTRSMFAVMELFTGSFTAQEKKNIEALKEVIEKNTTDYYPEESAMQAEDS